MAIDLVLRILEAKAQDKRNRSKRNWLSAVGLAAGALAGGIWAYARGLDPSGYVDWGFAIGVAGFLCINLFMHMRPHALFPIPARCPVCGHDWEYNESTDDLTLRMETWDRCPGCRTLMGDLVLELEEKRAQKLGVKAKPS